MQPKCSPYFHLIFGVICIYCFSSLFGPALFLILNTVIADISVFHFSHKLQDAMLLLLTPQVLDILFHALVS
jgi:hypothetical protein